MTKSLRTVSLALLLWIGAKVGLFAQGTQAHGEHSYVDVDWFRFERSSQGERYRTASRSTRVV